MQGNRKRNREIARSAPLSEKESRRSDCRNNGLVKTTPKKRGCQKNDKEGCGLDVRLFKKGASRRDDGRGRKRDESASGVE